MPEIKDHTAYPEDFLKKSDLASIFTGEGSLAGSLLIAMPSMADPRFAGTVVQICTHDASGTMGIVVNRLMGTMSLSSILQQMNLPAPDKAREIPVHWGGPVGSDRGFLMHSPQLTHPDAMRIKNDLSISATGDVLQLLVNAPEETPCLFALGFCAWTAGQLEQEMQSGGWLHAAGDPALVFSSETATKWHRALGSINVDPLLLSSETGHA